MKIEDSAGHDAERNRGSRALFFCIFPLRLQSRLYSISTGLSKSLPPS
jgi:hypothetical protein